MAKFLKISLLSIIILSAFIFVFQTASAQDQVAEGISQVDNQIILSSRDPRIMITRIINISLGFLGLISLVLVLYGGFLYMTSGGDEQKITLAKAVLKNAAIGLFIILASWGITVFILNRLGWATGMGGSIDNPRPPRVIPGTSALGACSVESVYPQPAQSEVPRNTSIIVSFKEEVDPATICNLDMAGKCVSAIPEVVRLFPASDNPNKECTRGSCDSQVELSVMSNDNKTFLFYTETPLEVQQENTDYTVYLSSGIKKKDSNESIFESCNPDFMEWNFTVNNRMDLEPPRVENGGAAPSPDYLRDNTLGGTLAKQAEAILVVKKKPLTALPATGPLSVDSDSLLGKLSMTVMPNCDEGGDMVVTIEENGAIKSAILQKRDSNGKYILLGSAQISSSQPYSGVFNKYFSFSINNSPAVGMHWVFQLTPKQDPDTLVVGDKTFTFVEGMANQFQIRADSVANTAEGIVFAIEGTLSNELTAVSDINKVTLQNEVTIQAVFAGKAGNNIPVYFQTTETEPTAQALSWPAEESLSGGQDEVNTVIVRGAVDQPRNAIIQIRFNEAINPIMVSGLSNEVYDHIRVVNEVSQKADGAGCAFDSDCDSYRCENTKCVGNVLAGKFVVSNQYKTIEFISDTECGVNGCGEKIYCLPENSSLRVELTAAALGTYNDDLACRATPGFPVLGPKGNCQDATGKNYPRGEMNGIMDSALNSLDGDRDLNAEGNISVYDESEVYRISSASSSDPLPEGDSYTWLFYVNDKIEIGAPSITSISPLLGADKVSVVEPITVNFDKLMMSSSLVSGSVLVQMGSTTVRHKRVNLWSPSKTPVGFWMVQEYLEFRGANAPAPDGNPDFTRMIVKHSTLGESVSYQMQVGSGVKDIYQNCFKPSKGPDCSRVSELAPSCCNGAVIDSSGLDPKTGNCQ